MAIDFTLTDEQRRLQLDARDFAENVLAPIVREADAEADPRRAFGLTKPAYVEAYRRGLAVGMIPEEYGGGGLSNVDMALVAEELSAVDPGFACTILVNGLGLMPVWYWGSEEQKRRFLRAATADASGEYLAGYALSEPPGAPGGTANFDAPQPYPVGISVTAELDGDDYVLNGRKYWAGNSVGWDGQGADVSLVVVRTDPYKYTGGTQALAAIMVERGTPGVSYRMIDKTGFRLTPNSEIIFSNARVPAANLLEGARGNGDLLVNRSSAWSGAVAAITAVGVARAAYEEALREAKSYTAGGRDAIIQHQNVGYVLGDVAARIEMCRYFCWKTAHYLDRHEYHGELIGAMCKIQCTELLFDAVYKCMQVVGVNSLELSRPFEKLLREASILPLYSGGNFGMQRRRVHGVLAHPDFDPRALMNDEMVEFTKEMEAAPAFQWGVE